MESGWTVGVREGVKLTPSHLSVLVWIDESLEITCPDSVQWNSALTSHFLVRRPRCHRTPARLRFLCVAAGLQTGTNERIMMNPWILWLICVEDEEEDVVTVLTWTLHDVIPRCLFFCGGLMAEAGCDQTCDESVRVRLLCSGSRANRVLFIAFWLMMSAFTKRALPPERSLVVAPRSSCNRSCVTLCFPVIWLVQSWSTTSSRSKSNRSPERSNSDLLQLWPSTTRRTACFPGRSSIGKPRPAASQTFALNWAELSWRPAVQRPIRGLRFLRLKADSCWVQGHDGNTRLSASFKGDSSGKQNAFKLNTVNWTLIDWLADR